MAIWFISIEKAIAPVNEGESITEELIDGSESTSSTTEYLDKKKDLIRVNDPTPNSVITSPLTITGQARGYWFFEGSFPVILVDWDGRIIAEHYASAQGEWMTEEFVPFTATIEFESTFRTGDPEFMSAGSLILKRDNPSDLPENDDSLEIPIRYTPM